MDESSVWQPIIYKGSFWLGALSLLSLEFVIGCAVIVVSSVIKNSTKGGKE
jgi:hypothetical protein